MANANAIEILEKVEDGAIVEDWSQIVPLEAENYWQLPNILECLASLSQGWAKKDGWYKLTRAERIARKRAELVLKYHILQTEPWLLED